ncbi:expressed unknown protein [Seminavis robusta]|uniref:Uncharacterized protein n=1 Tax=Seminavis robusta TaxID=568900 RepID=A0A9N8HWI0_9STRA|nr:expressed unknown protein [Seminavis robusta]|eukprot:Sro1652_g288790.1 n/a (206) ;mRNA; r:16785-17402
MKRSVSFVPFNDARNTQWIYEAYSTDVLWTTSEEQAASRHRTRQRARDLRYENEDVLLRDTFTTTDTDKNVQRSLKDFVKSNGNGRGMERFISREHHEERKAHRARAIKVIIMAQKEAIERGYELAELTEQLRMLSIKFSIHAKIFARRMGKADEACCYPKQKRSSQKQQQGTSVFVGAPVVPSAASASLTKTQISQRQLQAMTA